MSEYSSEMPKVYGNFIISRWSAGTAEVRLAEQRERLEHVALRPEAILRRLSGENKK